MRSTARHVIMWPRCIVESRDEVHSMASKVNELSDVKDVGGTEAKQERVLEFIALAPVAASRRRAVCTQ